MQVWTLRCLRGWALERSEAHQGGERTHVQLQTVFVGALRCAQHLCQLLCQMFSDFLLFISSFVLEQREHGRPSTSRERRVVGFGLGRNLLKLRDSFLQICWYRDGRRVGQAWEFRLGGGFVTGAVDVDGQLTNKGGKSDREIAYVYPDKFTALVGTFEKGAMIAARETRLDAFRVDETSIGVLSFKTPMGKAFAYEQSNKTHILTSKDSTSVHRRCVSQVVMLNGPFVLFFFFFKAFRYFSKLTFYFFQTWPFLYNRWPTHCSNSAPVRWRQGGLASLLIS